MNIRLFKNTRIAHKWIGMVGGIFFIILSVSGVILMHYESLGLNNIEISGKYLPEKYFQVAAAGRKIQAIVATDKKESTIFLGTDNGIYRSRNGGPWKDLREGLFSQDIRALAVVPNEENIIYAGTAHGIFKSEDGGDSWSDWIDESSGLANSDVRDLAIHPENSEIILAATAGGLFISKDEGDSWTLSFNSQTDSKTNPVNLIQFSTKDPDTLYIGTEKGIMRSTDSGAQWTEIWKDSISGMLSMIILDTDPEFIYIGSKSGLYKSFTQGRTWVKDKNKNFKNVRAIFANPQNISEIYLASNNQLFFSRDGGDNWEDIGPQAKNIAGGESFSNSAKIFNVLMVGSSPTLLTGTTVGLFVSDDGGKQWSGRKITDAANQIPITERKMDLVKLITEIHTGRFFGSYFFLLVDLATLGLVGLVFSGFMVAFYRRQLRRRKPEAVEEEEEFETDRIIEISETAEELSHESHEIHDMIEHISNHLEKCKTIYMTREKKEIDQIDRHITTLDKKVHHLMQRIGEFEKSSQN